MSRVLAVDDDPDVLALLEVTLARGGYDVVTAVGGDEALAAMRQSGVHLVLLDVMMPGRDGWSVLEEMKADRSLAEIPVIMVTARGEPIDRLRGGVGGALRYITKPFPPQKLLSEVADVLSEDAPEPVRRRVVQKASMSRLAELEAGREAEGPRPRMASLELAPDTPGPTWSAAVDKLETLTAKQRELMADLARGRSVARVAAERKVSRSNVYASIRRIHRKLGTETVEELAELARQTGLADGPR
jgi:DNA-binding response OmpR family regulator